MRSQLNNLFKKIVNTVNTKPLYRGMITYAVTYPTGSYVQQLLNKDQKEIDYKRIAKFAVFGSLIIAPGVNVWVNFISNTFVRNSAIITLTKVFLEQIIYAPIFYTVFYFGLTIMDGKTIEDGVKEVKTKALPTYKIGLMVWPFLQYYNYSYVTYKNRIVFMSFFGLLWTVYLSYTKYVLSAHDHDHEHGK